ncbi:HIPL1 protein [Hibiscus syriacus]|uniref:HIPL1 protein n=1 Tax=Hibiscus syriacus TaxID=106335 RepID=A0A6A2YPZ4_HIBSY|nr:HIPL1 protein [Hibiscus syriacus]
MGVFAVIFMFCNLLLLPYPSSSLPFCIDSRAPLTLKTALKFCSYNGTSCCNSTEDSKLQKQFQARNISDTSCASIVQAVLCATCDPFSAKLFTIDLVPRPVPLLCNSTVSSGSTQSNQATNDFCSECSTWPMPRENREWKFLDMVAHPDGSNRAFFSNQQGKIWLATIPKPGGTLELDESCPFIDLTDQVHFDTTFGLMGLHFTRTLHKTVGSLLHSVVTSVDHRDVQEDVHVIRIPTDGYLYFMMGDGGGGGDPYNFSQNKLSVLGKIMRLDVDNIPSAAEINRLGLWGNYSIPADNPYSQDEELLPEIWAYGLRTPWRCSFDSKRPSYFMCGDIGENLYEEVDMISKGGNYGWRVYEGPYPFNTSSPGGNTSLNSISPILPVMGYNHSEVSKKLGSASIIGGHFYRSDTDLCMYGRYLYADLYAGKIWAATEDPENSGNFSTSSVPFSCARDSPLQCSSVPNSAVAALGYIYSFGQDNNKDIHLLSSSGVYRVAAPSRCNYRCSAEKVTAVASPSPCASQPSYANQLRTVILLSASLLLLMACLA